MHNCPEKKTTTLKILIVILSLQLWNFCQLYLFADSSKLTIQGIMMMICIPSLWYSLIMMTSRSNSTAFVISTSLSTVIELLDRHVYSARLTHIHLSDLYSIGDAVRVMNKYPFKFRAEDCIVIIAVVIMNILIIRLSKKAEISRHWKNGVVVGLLLFILSSGAIVLGSLCGFVTYEINELFDLNKEFENKGIYYSLLCQINQSKIKEPEEYSPESAKLILNQMPEGESTSNNEKDAVSLIVIMNEAFSDYSLIGETLFEDPLKEIHNNSNNFIEGKLMTSVFGGYTCNTEFEFLTGCSMAFFPSETIPYVQLIKGKTISLCWDLDNYKYNSVAIHPYYSQEWNRQQIYNWFGFQQFIAGENFDTGLSDKNEIDNITECKLEKLNFGNNLEYIRGFISDRECYKKLLDEYNSGKDFIFTVTIQNHGGYRDAELTNENFEKKRYVEGNDAINEYLSCTAISDQAYKELIDALAVTDQKTIVLMFGDHQPGLDFSEYVEGYGVGANNPNQYCVPYIIWSNFELQHAFPKILSVNYLSAVLKQAAGLPLTEWDELRLQCMESCPVITANFMMDQEGNVIDESKRPAIIDDYEKVQYYKLFDE